MSRNLLSEFIHHLDHKGRMKIDHAPKKVKAWLEEMSLPMDIRRFLQWNWPQKDTQFGHIGILSSKNIYENEFTQNLLNQGYLLLGDAPNGDFFVLDISTEQCKPGFISHEEYWGNEDKLKSFYQPIARSLESFLYRIVERLYVPTDYYAAKNFNEFIEEEKHP